MCKIKVTACDNEMILVATPTTDLNDSFEICRIKSGYLHPVDVTINLELHKNKRSKTIELPKGVEGPLKEEKTFFLKDKEINLFIVGINWGGPGKWAIEVDGKKHEYQAPKQGQNMWTQVVKAVPIKEMSPSMS